MTREKGFDILIDAFARVAPRFEQWRLAIAGDGPLRPRLEAQAAASGVGDRIDFIGLRPDIDAVFGEAAIFALPSRFEGFPNALCEAMAHGLAVVASDCPSGPAEIVRPGTDGLLVSREDTDELAGALARLMADPGERTRLGASARGITERFAPAAVMRRWEELLLDVLGRS
jgi:glycosyltransferase involved in cell wall biosynthesis